MADQMPSKYLVDIFPPPDVVENVELLINDKATFHELPRKQGRRNRIVRTIIGPTNGGSDSPVGVGAAIAAGAISSAGFDVSSPGEPKSDGPVKRRRRRRVHPEVVSSGNAAGVQAKFPVTETDKERTEKIRKTLSRPTRKKRKTQEQVCARTGRTQTIDTATGEVLSMRGPTLEEMQEAGVAGVVVQALPTPEPETGIETVAKRKRGRPRKEKI